MSSIDRSGQTFYIDLLFYHVRLHRYFVFELKVGAFQPEHSGKLGFYLAAMNRTMRTLVEGPSIGVLLCESRSGPIVEFALETINQPIGVSTYHVTGSCRRPCVRSCPLSRTSRRSSTSSGRRWRRCAGSRPMINKAFLINGRRGIARSGQFCSSLLQN